MLTGTIRWSGRNSVVRLADTPVRVGAALVAVTSAVATLLAAFGSLVSPATVTVAPIRELFGAEHGITPLVNVTVLDSPAGIDANVVGLVGVNGPPPTVTLNAVAPPPLVTTAV